jgi:asparagine synthase (glutamine-hydrolysing)
MCGIFASIGFDPDQANLDLVSHRGPDGQGWNVFSSPLGPVTLGHRRLAIIDLSEAGHQPMSDDWGRFWLTFNGEIYNYRELRLELEAVGCRFRTASDSEVLLQALMTWGEAALNRTVGMFAFVLWDDRDKRLFAARDRYGVKPLYFVALEGRVAIGSEIKQLLACIPDGPRINGPRASDFLASGISDHTAETMFVNVRQLRGGECLSFIAENSAEAALSRWYVPARGSADAISHEAAAEHWRALLDESVRLHLRADVGVGTCLSGGLDSSSIAAIVSRQFENDTERSRFTAVSAVYPGSAVDEGGYARIMAEAAGLPLHAFTPDAQLISDNLMDIVRFQDEPFGSTSILSQWAVFREAKALGLKVMLDGQGADEQLAGYHWMFGLRLADLLRQGRLFALIGTLRERLADSGAAAAQDLARMVGSFAPVSLRKAIQARRRGGNGGDWLLTPPPVPTAWTAAADLGNEPANDIRAMCDLLTHSLNLPMLLHWEDRNSMAHGIEARVPFLDHRLVEFSLSLPADAKFDFGLTKRVLRDAMGADLPPRIRDRRSKLGFATPEQSWLNGALAEAIDEGVTEAANRCGLLIDRRAALAMKSRAVTGGEDTQALWRIANFGLWARQFRLSQ